MPGVLAIYLSQLQVLKGEFRVLEHFRGEKIGRFVVILKVGALNGVIFYYGRQLKQIAYQHDLNSSKGLVVFPISPQKNVNSV